MTIPRVITLLTDFGLADSYGAMMKGVIAEIAPTATVIDLTHQIPPQNVAAARFQLMTAYAYFPRGTVHVAVVDPGVGSQRRAIAVELDDGILVAPDNGLISGVLQTKRPQAAVVLNRPQYWRSANPSATFHGRDIFAPVAAHLAQGVPLQDVGEAIAPDSLVDLPLSTWQRSGNTITGCIQAIDHFGNGITTVPAAAVAGCEWHSIWGDRLIPGAHTYSDVPMGEPLLLVGSHGWVELAVNQGNAQQLLGFTWGSPLRLDLS